MTIKKPTVNYLSRSALAEKLGVTLKELTQSMIEAGWLVHNDNAEKGKVWQLTAKGEFEGGVYRDSKKFGQYIVWPESVIEHPAISIIKEAQITATTIAKSFDLSAKIINRLLAEMGWITAYAKGWKVTLLGEANGGVETVNQETGIPYVLWTRSILEHDGFTQHVKCYKGEEVQTISLDGQLYLLSLDGHYVNSKPELLIANWLYLSGFSYAYQHTIYLSVNDVIFSDFYLPKNNIHIHFQAIDISPKQLSQQLERQTLAQEHQLKVIEVTAADTEQLDTMLSKALLQLGISHEI